MHIQGKKGKDKTEEKTGNMQEMQLCLRSSRRIGREIEKIEKVHKAEGKVQKLQGDLAKVKP